ncbi:MAG: DUF6276 family protein [Halobacteriales archaeon]
MDCPNCDRPLVAFRVPGELREYAPDGEFAGICPDCLRLDSLTEAPTEPDFGRILDSFPGGEAGRAMALGVGRLVESLALNRDGIATCFEYAADRGADPWLVVERLATAGSVQPDADLDRARTQLEQLLD